MIANDCKVDDRSEGSFMNLLIWLDFTSDLSDDLFELSPPKREEFICRYQGIVSLLSTSHQISYRILSPNKPSDKSEGAADALMAVSKLVACVTVSGVA